ncbi:MAG: phosphoenolpyruvate--protein phosphotransferase [Elusimicrobiaceae bacterium]
MQDKDSFAVSSPVDGKVQPLSSVPDEAFAQGFLGPGAALDPISNVVKAPFDGKIKTLHKSLHALVLENSGVEVLIHVGVETVALNGKGFKALRAAGEEVKKGDALIEFDKNYIEQNAPCASVIVLAANPQDAELEITPLREVKSGEELFRIKNVPAPKISKPASGNFAEVKKKTVITAKDGLHARPAAAIAKTANTFEDVSVYISKQGKTANAKSMVEILSLGVNCGDEVEFSAQGARAGEALDAVMRSCAAQSTPPSDEANIITSPKQNFKGETKLNAQGVYPGIVIGKARFLKRAELKVCETAENAEEEKAKLLKAVENVKEKIRAEISACGANLNRKEILQAHLMMIEDPFLFTVCDDFILQGKSAAFAWQKAVLKSVEILESTNSVLLKERKADYKDMESRVLCELLGCANNKLAFPPDTILITDELLSGEISLLSENVKGLIMSGGSRTSHIAIMLKNISLPSVIAAGPDVLTVPEESSIILNSAKGQITVNPADIESAKEQQRENEERREKALASAFEPALTKDGTLIEVRGNIGNLTEAENAAAFGADGLGLVRSEFLFSSFRSAPSEEDQYQIYQKIADSQKGKSVIIRTFDVGGDKPLPFFPLPKEENPIVGLRGVRNYCLSPELFRTQIRAILRVTPACTAKIMLPMITFPEEVQTYKAIIKEEQDKLGVKEAKIGIMVEVPSAAVMADIFADQVDFMSLGTNDLTQYVLAIDRGSCSLSSKADTLNPAVLKLIYNTCQAGKKAGVPVGVCGAVASDVQAVPLLLGLGLRSLSVSGALIAEVKHIIRSLDIETCRAAALKALNMAEAKEVRTMLKETFKL